MVFTTRVHNTELPLRMMVLNTSDFKYQEFYDKMKYAEANFSMVNEETGQYVIANKEAEIIFEETPHEPYDRFRVILQYCFTKRELKRFGYFRAEFGIYFTDCGTELHVPIKEKLYVNVLDTITHFN